MCQAGNDLRAPGLEFSEAQAPLDIGSQLTRCWSAEMPVQEAAAFVAHHIVARLVASHAFVPETPLAADVTASPAVAVFVDLLLGPNSDSALNWVMEQRRRGTSCEAMCHDVLAPAARHVRAMWRNDVCDYAAFQLGQWRLCRLLNAIDHSEVCRRAVHRDPAAALLVTLSGGEPTFEHALVAQYFARSGWTARSHAPGQDIAAVLRSARFHIAWISIDEAARRQDIVACVRMIRRASQNRAIGILCGGMELDPMPASWELGADAVAADARTALAVAERWRMWQSETETPWTCVA